MFIQDPPSIPPLSALSETTGGWWPQMVLQRGLHSLSLSPNEHVLVCNPGLAERLCVNLQL